MAQLGELGVVAFLMLCLQAGWCKNWKIYPWTAVCHSVISRYVCTSV